MFLFFCRQSSRDPENQKGALLANETMDEHQSHEDKCDLNGSICMSLKLLRMDSMDRRCTDKKTEEFSHFQKVQIMRCVWEEKDKEFEDDTDSEEVQYFEFQCHLLNVIPDFIYTCDVIGTHILIISKFPKKKNMFCYWHYLITSKLLHPHMGYSFLVDTLITTSAILASRMESMHCATDSVGFAMYGGSLFL